MSKRTPQRETVTDAQTVEVPRSARLNVFALNVVLALAWALTTGAFSLLNLTVGFVLAFLALWLPWRMWGDDTYFRRPWRLLRLLVTFVWELVVSATTVAMLVLMPGLKFRPAIVAVPLGHQARAWDHACSPTCFRLPPARCRWMCPTTAARSTSMPWTPMMPTPTSAI